MSRTMLTAAGVALAAALFLLVNVAGDALLGGARLDLTENGLYTLSEGSRRLVAGLDEPVTLRLYYSERLAADIPPIRAYAQRVRGLLEEYVAASDGMLRLQVIDPQPFSEEEDEAVAAGLQGALIESGPSDLLYFGIVASGPTDEQAQIPFLSPEREASLEYDLGRLVHKLGTTTRPVVGVLSSLALEGRPRMPFPGAPEPTPPWFALELMRERFDVRMLEAEPLEIPDDCRLLMLVHPKDLPEASLVAIDQFVLGGGRLLAFVDPHCEEDRPPADPGNPMAAMTAPRSSGLPALLAAWGVEMLPDKVLGDRARAIKVRSGSAARPEPIDYVLWLSLTPGDLAPDDFVTSELGGVTVASAGILRPLEGASTTVAPLVRSSEQSMEIELSAVQFFPDPKRLLLDFLPSGEPRIVAARVTGPARTAFPERASADFLEASVEDIQVIVVADVDFLADASWVRMQSFLGQRIPLVTASNGDFTLAALDNLSNSADLFLVRRRARFDRPFERMDELRRRAELRFLAREQELQEALRTAERRLTELQGQRQDGSSLILSPEQREEIERFRAEQVATRKALRDVQHDLRKDIESLESRIKLFNMALVPLAVGVVAAGLGGLRRRRRGAA